MALLTAAVLDSLSRRGRAGTAAAALLATVLVAFGLGRYRGYLETYASPLTSTEIADAP